MTIRILAIADSDSYLKWACATLDTLRGELDAEFERTAVVIGTPIAPSESQIAAAVVGTGIVRPALVSRTELRRLLGEMRPDVVLIAATGPVAEMVARDVVAASPHRRPALISGLPGMALPATELGTGFRRWTDAFVVHSLREAEAYRDAFVRHGVSPRLVLARLPFLAGAAHRVRQPVERVLFAAQALVPPRRPERVALLDGLARTAASGLDVVVKLRARAGERQTHNEAFPLDVLWEAEHARLGHDEQAVRFVDGPMAEWLEPGTALVTVSSSAALESLALGLPTVVLDDFGVSEELLNAPFAGSGCVGSLADLPELLRAGGPDPEPGWLRENYLHTSGSELPQALRELAEQSWDQRLRDLGGVAPVSRVRYLRTVARSLVPGTIARRLVRPVR